jgi:hypothetical protein
MYRQREGEMPVDRKRRSSEEEKQEETAEL